MYQALYRKYRSKTFSDVCGQDHIVTTLRNQIDMGKISHAYLFTGSRGTGKTSCAKILAKAVNCTSPKDGDPCLVCSVCEGIENGSILDIIEIDAASNNGVDDIRDLKEKIEYTPSACKYRVYIIDEVHMLSPSAFNALLKTLEEPPAHGIFILATTEIHKLPATIISRCQRFDFNRISVEIIESRLFHVCEKEGIILDKTAANLIARIANGGMRDALSLLDLVSASDKIVTEQTVTSAAGLVTKDYLYNFAHIIKTGTTGEMLSLVDELHMESKDMERLVVELISFFRDMLVFKTAKKPSNLVVMTEEQTNKMNKIKEEFTIEKITRLINLLSVTADQMKTASSKRTTLEIALIRLMTPALEYNFDAILDRIANVEQKLNNNSEFGVRNSELILKAECETRNTEHEVQNTNLLSSLREFNEFSMENASVLCASRACDEAIQPNESEVKTEEKNEIEIEPLPEQNSELRIPNSALIKGDLTSWPEILIRLSKENAMLNAVLAGSTAAIENDTVYINSKNSTFISLFKELRHKNSLSKAIFEMTGTEYNIALSETAEKEDITDQLDLFINSINSDILEVE